MAVVTQGRLKEWRPLPKQKQFLEAEEDEVLYGGAAGGGKTDALVVFSIIRRMAIPNSRGLYLRRTYPELEMSVKGRFQELLEGTGAVWNERTYSWRFPNGSIQYLSYLDNDDAVYRYQSAEFEDIVFDELTTLSEFQFSFMQARCRTTKPGVKPLIRAATNPLGIGYMWVKSYFVDPAPPGDPFTVTVELPDGRTFKRTRRFIPATVRDNPYLPETYMASLASLPERERRALLDGDWDIMTGGFFSEFDPKVHVIEPFEIPEDWTKFIAYDHGFAKPFSVGWYAVDHDGKVYRYREWYGAKRPDVGLRMDVPEIAEGILARTPANEKISYYVADPSIWAKTGLGPSIAEVFLECGIPFVPGDNQRIQGWTQVHHRLLSRTLFVFKTCEQFLRVIPYLTPDERNPEDLDTRQEDHIADELRYACMSRPIVPERPKKPKTFIQEYKDRLLARSRHGARSWVFW